LQTLKNEDYKRILKFVYFINEDYANMPDRVLFATEEYLSYPLCVYTIFNRTVDGAFYVEKVMSNNVPRKGLNEYRDGVYKTDLFFNRLSYFKQGRKNRYVFLKKDVATPDEFFATEYGKYLIRINTPHQAVILSSSENKLPLHVLNVFKTKEKGEFTETERYLLNQAGEAFSFGIRKYKQFMATQNKLRLIDTVRDEKETVGVAILDENSDPVYSDSHFAAAVSRLYDTENAEAGLMELLKTCVSKHNQDVREISEAFSAEDGDYCFCFTPRMIENSEGAFRYMTIAVKRISPRPGKEERRVPKSVYEEYALTPKETEVIEWMLTGLDNASIAENMSINISTVKFHIMNIFSKTNANSRASVISKLMARHRESSREYAHEGSDDDGNYSGEL
jgi:DNA-binding CsgD family transcriptional regulator